jgi:hypothetical protein
MRFWLLGALLWPALAAGQTMINPVESLNWERPESWALKYYASATLMTSMGTPRPLRFGQIRLALEVDWLPYVSNSQQVVGFDGTKAEDLNKLPVVVRPRLTIGLPWKLSLTLAYVPPIEINEVSPNLFSVSLGRPFQISRSFVVGLTIYGQAGHVTSDFTCPQSAVLAGNDPVANPFGCTQPSQDQADLNYVGAELSASYRIRQAHGLEPYGTLAFNYMILNFHTNARYNNIVDRTELQTQGSTTSMTLGLLYPVTRRFDIASEVFYTPLTVRRDETKNPTVEGLFNVRALVAYRFF